ncbi:discoidin domain-containing protein [Cohnella sp. REN36]|uniref:discoidin domain-containing protein n=1 Tax=Cohnella sp. REN36 TaxID=2887347 RepID=UPI001D14DDA0|nr:discoidin domain-containing protein [Cohnella sp. REN36]MCC3371522.1 discoidin domain-containing protein [Cohnella sp. REN36]
MKRKTLKLLLSCCLLFGMLPWGASAATPPESVIYGGGPFYAGGTATMNDLRQSGFTTVMLWTIHVNANGDLYYNDQKVVSNGAYVGKASWPSELATLKQAPTSVKRLEISVGSWGVNDFQNIKDLIAAQGTGTTSILYKNFSALKNAIGGDAISFDNEDLYDVNSSAAFGNMLAGLGYKITLCPYTNVSYWQSVKSQLGTKVDRIYLQVYDGGAGNNPSTWSSQLGMTVMPGLDSKTSSRGNTPAQVNSRMSAWKASAGIAGGFIWYYDAILNNPSGGSAADYAAAINGALGSPSSGSIATGGTVTASQGGSPSGEEKEKAFDGSSATKWLIFAASGWIQYQFGSNAAYAATSYSITSANDYAARDPKNWTLLGSNDGATWTTLDTQTNQTFASRFQTKSYSFGNTTAYKYYRLNVTANNGGAELQIAEIGLYL